MDADDVAAQQPVDAQQYSRPDWLDTNEYPFTPHYFDLAAGRMHYVDEGAGELVVLVHGTPTWSFMYRRLIKDLAPTHRVVAPDNLGFGLSDKPGGADYTPAAHGARLRSLIEGLDLRHITLVVHDFGGPIGLSYAIENPANVRRIVVMNTFMWPLDDPHFSRPARLLDSWPGRFLYRRLNFSPRVMMRMAFGDKSRLTRAIHRHYLSALPDPDSRTGTWVLAQSMMASKGWFSELWERRSALDGKPMLIAWGMKDRAFRPAELERWTQAFPSAEVVRLETAGHFVPEEAPEELGEAVRRFVG